MSIINIIGLPAVGKSTLGRRLQSAFPDFVRLDIDDYRRAINTTTPRLEAEAWTRMLSDAKKYEHVIIESTGMSHNTSMVLSVLARKVVSIHLQADEATRTQRLATRKAAGYVPVPLYFVPSNSPDETKIFVLSTHFNPYQLDTTMLDEDDVFAFAKAVIDSESS